jgi:hypothetical protein
MKKEIEIFPEQLTEEESAMYAEKAEQLAKELNASKVHVVVQMKPDTFERAVCYLREPNYLTKVRVMDKAASLGVYTAAEELREMSVIKEHSDSLTYSDHYESDRYKIGILDYCLGMISRLQNQFKKK